MADLSELASILKENPAFVKGALDAFWAAGQRREHTPNRRRTYHKKGKRALSPRGRRCFRAFVRICPPIPQRSLTLHLWPYEP